MEQALPTPADYDQSLRGRAKLSREEQRGLAVLKGKGKCAKCHTLGEGGAPALFTDFSFDNLGTPENPNNPRYPGNDPGLGGFPAAEMAIVAFLKTLSDGWQQ